MAIPTVRAVGSPVNAGNATSVDVPWPAGSAADDIGLLFVENNSVNAAPAAPSGWVAVTGSPVTAGTFVTPGVRLSIFWKRHSGSETNPAVISDNHVDAVIIAFDGCIESGDPWNITATDSTVDAPGTTVTAPGGTTTVADTLVVVALAQGQPDAAQSNSEFSSWTNGDLSSVTQRVDVFTNSGNGGGLGVATGGKAAAGAFGSTTATAVTDTARAFITVALQPPGAAFESANLYATATQTIADVVDELDTTIDLHLSVDDDPDTPNDADWVNNAIDIADDDASVFFDVTDLPGDFGNAETGEIEARFRGQNFGSGTINLYARLYRSDETTPLSDEVLVATATADTAFANASLVAFTGLDTAADKAVWDAARIRFRWGNASGFTSGFSVGFES